MTSTVQTSDESDPTAAGDAVPPFEIRDPGPRPEGIEITIDLITPEVATDLLRANPFNRRLRPRHAHKLSGAMARGEFVFNGDPIRICTHGDLLDGQHRCEGCIESGQSFWAVVIRGLPCDVIHTIDTDMAVRNIRDVLRIQGDAHADVLAAAIAWKWRKEAGLVQTKDSPTPAQALAVLDKYPDLRAAAAQADNSKPLKLMRVSKGLTAALMFEFHTIDPDDATSFFTKFTSGAALEAGDPVLALRDYLQKVSGRDRTGKRRASQVEIYMTVVKAWNLWRGGQQARSVAWVGSKHAPVEPQ